MMQAVRQAVKLILDKQAPYPAIVLDRFWHVLDANAAHRRLMRWAIGDDRAEGGTERNSGAVNMMKLVFDPTALWPAIANREAVGRYLARRVRQELALHAIDPATQRLLADIRTLQPALFDAADAPAQSSPAPDAGDPSPFLPVTLQRDSVTISLFSTLTTLGTPRDAGLQEMRIECFYPADEASRRALERITL